MGYLTLKTDSRTMYNIITSEAILPDSTASSPAAEVQHNGAVELHTVFQRPSTDSIFIIREDYLSIYDIPRGHDNPHIGGPIVYGEPYDYRELGAAIVSSGGRLLPIFTHEITSFFRQLPPHHQQGLLDFIAATRQLPGEEIGTVLKVGDPRAAGWLTPRPPRAADIGNNCNAAGVGVGGRKKRVPGRNEKTALRALARLDMNDYPPPDAETAKGNRARRTEKIREKRRRPSMTKDERLPPEIKKEGE